MCWSRFDVHDGGARGGTSDWQTGCQHSHNEGIGRVSLLRSQNRDRERERKKKTRKTVNN